MIPEVLFNKSPPPGGTLGELTQHDETLIDFTKMNVPLEYTEINILKGTDFFCNLFNLQLNFTGSTAFQTS